MIRSYRQVIFESKKDLVPAIKYNNKLYLGKVGEVHHDIWAQNFSSKKWQHPGAISGFLNQKTKKFHLPYEVGLYGAEDLRKPQSPTIFFHKGK